MPKKKFLIRLLSQLDENHKIFDLDYVAPLRESLQVSKPIHYVEVNQDLLVSGVASRRKKGKNLRMPISKDERHEIKMKALEARIKALTEKSHVLKAQKRARI